MVTPTWCRQYFSPELESIGELTPRLLPTSPKSLLMPWVAANPMFERQIYDFSTIACQPFLY